MRVEVICWHWVLWYVFVIARHKQTHLTVNCCAFSCVGTCVCMSVCVCDMKECSISFSMHTHTRARALALQRRSLVLRPQRKRGWVRLGEQQMHKNKSWWALYARRKNTHTHTLYRTQLFSQKHKQAHIHTHALARQRTATLSIMLKQYFSTDAQNPSAREDGNCKQHNTHTYTTKKQQLVGGCLAPKTHAHKHTH